MMYDFIESIYSNHYTKLEQMEIPERTFLHSTTKERRVTGPPRLLYDTFGNAVSYTPSFHVRLNFL